jgi:DNA-binding CsgD family transcriptional regulator
VAPCDEGRLEWAYRALCPHDVALSGTDPVFRLMAHALDCVTTQIDATIACYSLIDAHPGAYAIGPCVMKARGLDASAMERLYDYFAVHAAEDPLTRLSLARPSESLFCSDEFVAPYSYAEAPFVARLREEFEIGPRLRLIFREGAAPAAIVALLRMHGDAEFSADDKGFLRASHEFLEAVHTIAVRTARADACVEHIARLRGLTLREREVVKLALGRASNAAIGADLAIAASTVRRHLRCVYNKLGITTRGALARAVFEQGAGAWQAGRTRPGPAPGV